MLTLVFLELNITIAVCANSITIYFTKCCVFLHVRRGDPREILRELSIIYVENNLPPTESLHSMSESSTEAGSSASQSINENKAKDSPTNENEGKKFGSTQAFKDQFKAFSKFGDTKSDGKHMTLSQSDKWMKQAKVIDGKKITTTDTGIYFKKFKCLKISLEDYKKFIEDLARSKKMDLQDIEMKMSTCGTPSLHGAASNAKIDSTIERLTDVSKYTGSHKLRFDDTGKGKGIAGRKDIVDNSGYVSGYQNKDTYSKTH